jgi:hypothetical protein
MDSQRYRRLLTLVGGSTSARSLGSFLVLAKLIRELEPQARIAAINFALTGAEIPGFTLVRHETSGYVETETLSQLFAQCPASRMPALLSAIAKILSHVSGNQYRALCAAIGVNPDKTAIKQAGANPFCARILPANQAIKYSIRKKDN